MKGAKCTFEAGDAEGSLDRDGVGIGSVGRVLDKQSGGSSVKDAKNRAEDATRKLVEDRIKSKPQDRTKGWPWFWPLCR